MKETTLHVSMQFIRPLLGTTSGNPEIQAEFIISRSPKIAAAMKALNLLDPKTNEDKAKRTKLIMELVAGNVPDEIAAVTPLTAEELEAQIEKASTIFPKDEIGVFMWDYQLRGFIKEAVGVLIELGDIKLLSKWQFKKAIDSFVFVRQRKVYLKTASGESIKEVNETLQRPLRAVTMQGERVALARSEMLPETTKCEFDVILLEGTNSKSKLAVLTQDDIKSAFAYGRLKGMLQWRSGGFGSFESQISQVAVAGDPDSKPANAKPAAAAAK